MLMSAAIELRFHYWPKTGEDIIYRPSVLSRVTCASWSKDNTYLTYISDKAKPEIISLKDTSNLKLVHTLTAISDIASVAFQHTTKRCLAVGTHNGQVVLYDTKSKTINRLFGNVPSGVLFTDFNCNDEHLAAACVNGNAVLYDAVDGQVCGNYIVSESFEPTALRFHPNLPHILAASTEEGTVMLWDTATANKTFFAQTHTSPICGIAFGKQNNDVIVTVGEDNKFCIHDLNIRECIFRSSVQHPLSAVDVCSDGISIAIGSQDGMIYIFDVRNFLQPVVSWKAHNSKITQLLFERPIREYPLFFEESSTECTRNSKSMSEQSNHKSLFKAESERTDNETSSKASYSSRKSFEKVRDQSDNEYLKKLKAEVIASIRKDAQEVNNHLKMHMSNLQQFIQSEFHKMDAQMDDKWELLNMASANLAKEGDDATYSQSVGRDSSLDENRMVLE